MADELWRLFEFIELIEVMWQRGNPFFIGKFIKIRIGEIDDNSETMLKLMFGNNKEIDYPKQNLHIFAENAENAPVSNNISIQIQSIHVIASNCGFSETELVTTQNRKPSDTGGLPKCLKLKLKSKVTLATNLNV